MNTVDNKNIACKFEVYTPPPVFKPVRVTIELKTPEAAQEFEARLLMSYDHVKRWSGNSPRVVEKLTSPRTTLTGIDLIREKLRKLLGATSISNPEPYKT